MKITFKNEVVVGSILLLHSTWWLQKETQSLLQPITSFFFAQKRTIGVNSRSGKCQIIKETYSSILIGSMIAHHQHHRTSEGQTETGAD